MELSTNLDLRVFNIVSRILGRIRSLRMTIIIGNEDRYGRWREFLGVRYSTIPSLSSKFSSIAISTNKLDLNIISRSLALLVIINELLSGRAISRKILCRLGLIVAPLAILGSVLSLLGLSDKGTIALVIASIIYAVVEVLLKMYESSKWELIRKEGTRLISSIEELSSYEMLRGFIRDVISLCIENRGISTLGVIGVFKCNMFKVKKYGKSVEYIIKVSKVT